MNELTDELRKSELQTLATEVREELANYEEQIRKYRAGEVDETKMQKLRLHFGTYAQRQEGVQMQRIKIPGGFLSGDPLARLAGAADMVGHGFIPFTHPADVQSSLLETVGGNQLLP